ncbi:MAG: DUF4831 family protein [Marinifilaceae bacterium]
MKRILSIIILCLLVQITFANTIKSIDDIKVKINYNLPRTVLDLKISLERTVYRKGIFSQYAVKYLGASSVNVINEDGESWSLESVKIDQHREIDPMSFYSIEMQENYDALKLNLTPEGFLAGFNSSYVSGFESSKIELFSKRSQEVVASVQEYFCIDRPFLIEQDSVIIDKDVKKGLKSEGKVKGKRVPKTLEQKAADAAHYIFKLRKRRFKILSCNYEHLPADGLSYQVIVQKLNALEKQYLELFLGKTEVYTETRDYSYIPMANVDRVVIAKYSVDNGFLDSKNLSGVPVTIKTSNILVDRNAKTLLSKQIIEGRYIYYRVPARVNIEILDGNHLIGRKNMIIPQLGVIANISVDVLIEKKFSVDFYPEYGSLKTIRNSGAKLIKN